jgi:hypothetical protein
MATKGLRHVLDGYKALDLAIIRLLTTVHIPPILFS